MKHSGQRPEGPSGRKRGVGAAVFPISQEV